MRKTKKNWFHEKILLFVPSFLSIYLFSLVSLRHTTHLNCTLLLRAISFFALNIYILYFIQTKQKKKRREKRRNSPFSNSLTQFIIIPTSRHRPNERKKKLNNLKEKCNIHYILLDKNVINVSKCILLYCCVVCKKVIEKAIF